MVLTFKDLTSAFLNLTCHTVDANFCIFPLELAEFMYSLGSVWLYTLCSGGTKCYFLEQHNLISYKPAILDTNTKYQFWHLSQAAFNNCFT